MKEREYHLHDGKSGSAITVRIVAHAGQPEIGEILDDGTVTVRLKSQGSEAKTNSALLTFLADVLQVRPEQLEVVAGMTGPDKLITIMDLDKNIVHNRIMERVR